jgi:hypothetical protein
MDTASIIKKMPEKSTSVTDSINRAILCSESNYVENINEEVIKT